MRPKSRHIFITGLITVFLLGTSGAAAPRLYHRLAAPAPTKVAHLHAEHGDEIDKAIEKYFEQIKSSRKVDVDQRKLDRIFGRSHSASKSSSTETPDKPGSFSFSNTTTPGNSPKGSVRSHQVQKGDTIWSISRKYGLKPSWILLHNPSLRKRPLYIGEEILIARKGYKAVVKRRTLYYRVKRKDNLSRIARRYRVSVAQLRKWNRLGRKSTLSIGQRLKVRKGRVVIPRGFAYKKVFDSPLKGGRISSRFGRRYNPFTGRSRQFHKGVDIAAPMGTAFRAARSGLVIYAGRMGGYGNCIFVRHPGGFVSVYAHGKLLKVRRGETVKKGQVIGYVGRTGNATGPHLHFEIRRQKRPINPLYALRMKELAPVSRKAASRVYGRGGSR